MEKVTINRIMYFDGFESECSDQMSALIVTQCVKLQNYIQKESLKNEMSCLNEKYLYICAQLFNVWLNTKDELHNEMSLILKKIPQFQFFIEYFTPFVK
jgi:hypothetical protein